MKPAACALFPFLVLVGCSSPPPPIVVEAQAPATDALYWPRRVEPGRLEYAPDGSTFAPVLTERFPYPTQPQANDAYRRFLAGAPPDVRATSVRLFGCKPGALDAQTARVTRFRGPVAHCATDFLDPLGRNLGRETVNFYYEREAWSMQPVNPPRSLAPWLKLERSPKGRWWWVPGRDRYE